MNKADIKIHVTTGDLLKQDVEVIVNAWNRNIIPWWLLIPQGVSGAIKQKAGKSPFRELAAYGAIPLGNAVITGAGKLPYKAIIHVAGINMLWRSSEKSIRDSVRNAISLAESKGFTTMAFPLIGAGSGGFKTSSVKELILDEIAQIKPSIEISVVEFRKSK